MVLPPKSSDREALIREAFLLEWLTIGWMSVEAAIAIASGIMAGSLVVTAFGLDSLIELASGGVLMWRLSVELHYGQAFSEDAERRASRIAGGLLFALAAYVTMAALMGPLDTARRSVLLARFYRGGGGDTGDAVSCTSQDSHCRQDR